MFLFLDTIHIIICNSGSEIVFRGIHLTRFVTEIVEELTRSWIESLKITFWCICDMDVFLWEFWLVIAL